MQELRELKEQPGPPPAARAEEPDSSRCKMTEKEAGAAKVRAFRDVNEGKFSVEDWQSFYSRVKEAKVQAKLAEAYHEASVWKQEETRVENRLKEAQQRAEEERQREREAERKRREEKETLAAQADAQRAAAQAKAQAVQVAQAQEREEAKAKEQAVQEPPEEPKSAFLLAYDQLVALCGPGVSDKELKFGCSVS